MWDGPDPRSDDSRDREAADPREESRDPHDALTRDLNLPRGMERERVHVHEHRQDYHLRGSEVRALATIGTFRVVPASDLRDDAGRQGDVRHGDLERLRSAGLIETVAPFDAGGERTMLVTLTERGRDVLESHRTRGSGDSSQTYYAGHGSSRELTHDGQLYRAYLNAEERLRAEGSRVDRVLLDVELKREYQRFLQDRNRGRADSDGRPGRSRSEIKEWALDHDLRVVNDRVQFPDLQIHHERDGRRDVENVEVTTVHYRGSHASGKVAAGFSSFRGRSGRVGGAGSREGASPFDPHSAEKLLR